jgi:DinB family protein
MDGFAEGQDLTGHQFRDMSLRGARFVESDLTDVVIRGCEISGLEIDAPWLRFGKPLVVNGVDVVAFVEAELNRRFPGREQQTASTPEGLRAAWDRVEVAWSDAVARAGSLPAGSVDLSVAGEWSFAQTLRHLVAATDKWLGGARGVADRHPLGLDHAAVDAGPPPAYADVLAVRGERQAMVREFVAGSTPALLDEDRPSPNDPARRTTVREIVQVILEEEWEHLRFATRDLDAIAAGSG